MFFFEYSLNTKSIYFILLEEITVFQRFFYWITKFFSITYWLWNQSSHGVHSNKATKPKIVNFFPFKSFRILRKKNIDTKARNLGYISMRENLIKQLSRTITPQSQRHILHPKILRDYIWNSVSENWSFSWASHWIINTNRNS